MMPEEQIRQWLDTVNALIDSLWRSMHMQDISETDYDRMMHQYISAIVRRDTLDAVLGN